MAPSEDMLDLLWSFCTISVAQARGFHECDLSACSRAIPERKGVKLSLGSAEIRVFSVAPAVIRNPVIYAAPNLIYHYVSVHHYKPPDLFLDALREGPRPLNPEYFEQLKKLDLDWHETRRL